MTLAGPIVDRILAEPPSVTQQVLNFLRKQSNIAGIWKQDEQVGTIVNDYGPNNIQMTLTNSPQLGKVLGQNFRGVAYAAASTQYADGGTPSAMQITAAQALTIVQIGSYNATAAPKTVLAYGPGGGGVGWGFRVNEDENLEFWLRGTGDLFGETTEVIGLGSARVIGLSKAATGNASGLSFYENATLLTRNVATVTNHSGTNPTYTAQRFAIGARYNSSASQTLDGTAGITAMFLDAKPLSFFQELYRIACGGTYGPTI